MTVWYYLVTALVYLLAVVGAVAVAIVAVVWLLLGREGFEAGMGGEPR